MTVNLDRDTERLIQREIESGHWNARRPSLVAADETVPPFP